MDKNFKNFKSIYLVCLEQDNDMNYVLARNPSLKKARYAAEKSKLQFPDNNIYITVEKVLKESPKSNNASTLGSSFSANTGSKICVCGRRVGGCVSNLSCRCSAISICKQMNTEEEGPYYMLGNSSEELEGVEITIVRISRNLVEVFIPDWADNSIGLSANDFPRDILTIMKPGSILSANINIDAESEDDLIIKDIKLIYNDSDQYQSNLSDKEIAYDEEDLDYDEEEDYELEDYDDDDDELEDELEDEDEEYELEEYEGEEGIYSLEDEEEYEELEMEESSDKKNIEAYPLKGGGTEDIASNIALETNQYERNKPLNPKEEEEDTVI